jgi:hypothetical protein
LLCRLTNGTGKVRGLPGLKGKHLGIMIDSTVLAYTKAAIAALRRRI